MMILTGIVDALRRLIAGFLSLFIFTSIGVSVNPMTAEDPGQIRLNVSIVSDGHMEGNNTAGLRITAAPSSICPGRRRPWTRW